MFSNPTRLGEPARRRKIKNKKGRHPGQPTKGRRTWALPSNQGPPVLQLKKQSRVNKGYQAHQTLHKLKRPDRQILDQRVTLRGCSSGWQKEKSERVQTTFLPLFNRISGYTHPIQLGGEY